MALSKELFKIPDIINDISLVFTRELSDLRWFLGGVDAEISVIFAWPKLYTIDSNLLENLGLDPKTASTDDLYRTVYSLAEDVAIFDDSTAWVEAAKNVTQFFGIYNEYKNDINVFEKDVRERKQRFKEQIPLIRKILKNAIKQHYKEQYDNVFDLPIFDR